MLPKETSMGSLFLAVTLAAILATGGYENWQAMRDKAQAQAAAVSEFQQWKKQYTQLLPVEQQWKEQLRSVDEARDLYSVYTLLGSVPTTNPDTLLIEKIERVTHEGVDLQAQRVCLTSGSAGGVEFEEGSFDTLLKGLNELAARPDVQMSSAVFTHDKGRARAVVKNLCLLLRDAEGAPK